MYTTAIGSPGTRKHIEPDPSSPARFVEPVTLALERRHTDAAGGVWETPCSTPETVPWPRRSETFVRSAAGDIQSFKPKP